MQTPPDPASNPVPGPGTTPSPEDVPPPAPGSGAQGAAPSHPGVPSPAYEFLRTTAQGVGAAARHSGPPLRRFAQGFGDWLAGIGWGKFFLLAILLLILCAIATPYLPGVGETAVVAGDVEVKVRLEDDTGGGLRLTAPTDTRAGAPGPAPGTAARHGAHGVPSPPKPPAAPGTPGTAANARASDPDVRIDASGVHINAVDDNGEQVRVAIDRDGVRVLRSPGEAAGAPATPATPGASDGPAVHLAPEVLADPERTAQAVESARSTVEGIVQEQVDRQVQDAVAHAEPHRSEDSWLEPFVSLLILGLIILKVVLGGKRKAELTAERASAAAADEGLRRQLAEAQLKTMQAQIEPHFLFNTLASVDYLIETDPPRASRMQKNLIQYLRLALPQMREDSSTLGRELEQCRAYLEILRMRMEERLQYSLNVPQGLLDSRFPPMMLLTLVENSIKHGLEPKAEGGAVSISAGLAAGPGGGTLHVTVADTGLGLATAGRGGTGVGLSNLRERLRAMYGTAARLTIEQGSAGGTIATIELPAAARA